MSRNDMNIKHYKEFSQKLFHSINFYILAALLLSAVFSQTIRYAIFYNLLPLIVLYAPILMLQKKTSKKIPTHYLLVMIVFISGIIYLRHLIVYGPYAGWDSREFIAYGKAFTEGRWLSGVVYRSPLYPFFVGIIFSLSDNPILIIVIIQHLLLLASIPLVFYLTRCCEFNDDTALCAALFFATSSMTLRMAQFIMSEILFLFLLLCAILSYVRYYKHRSVFLAIITGIMFSAATHCRQLASPIFYFLLLITLFPFKVKTVMSILILLITFTLCNIPWSLHNKIQHNFFGMSAHLGANIFTKTTSFRLEHITGKKMARIRPQYEHVLEDLDLVNYTPPSRPEDRWDINRIPHQLLDTLTRYHGYSYPEASKILTAISIESFLAHPIRYVFSIIKTLRALTMHHIELYPKITRIFPIKKAQKIPPKVHMFLRGMVYIPGLFLFIFLIIILSTRNYSILSFLPMGVIITGYLITAAIQVGFTRYTVPWIPYLSICGAYVIIMSIEVIKNKTLFFCNYFRRYRF